MFTGIIQAVGQIRELREQGGDRRYVVATPAGFLQGAGLGDSIACSGVCLTVVGIEADAFVVDVSAETLRLTTADAWVAGVAVNLEKALTPSTLLGGHLVSGHVDGRGQLVAAREDARSWRLEFEVPAPLSRYIARQGSIAVDGISLTVNQADGRRFGVNIVPHTRSHTTLGAVTIGGAVNIEVDLIARYLERLMAGSEDS